jgi:phosphatidylglycerophosphatase A
VQALARILATAGGVGNIRVAPGTFGALVVVPLAPWVVALRGEKPVALVAGIACVVAIAVWAAGRTEIVFGRHDDGRIVVDEVAGMLVTAVLLPVGWTAVAVGFLLFRLFDVVKPPPAAWIDRRVRGGIGVVGDDLVAGLYAGLFTRLALALLAV